MSIPQMHLYNSFSDWVTVTNSIANEVGDLSLFSGQNIGQSDIVNSLNNLDVLKYNKVGGIISGFVTIGQTLSVEGDTTLYGNLNANGNIIVGSNAITLNSTSGNGLFTGALSVAGTTSLGVTSISSALTVTGNSTFNSNVILSGSVTPGNRTFNITNGSTTKFSVDSTSGNTLISGTLGITDIVTLDSSLRVLSDLTINTNKFTVSAVSGNTTIAGSLSVSDVATFAKPITSTTGLVSANSPIFSATQTWNNAGTVFNGLLVNITNTSSASGSLLLAFQQSGLVTFGVTTGGTITQQTTTSNLARTVISNLAELRTIREYQDLSDGLTIGTQGLDINSISGWSNTYNARWDIPSKTYIKDRSLVLDHSYMSRMSEDFKQQWWFSDGTTANSNISWVKRVEFDMVAATYIFNGAITAGSLNTSNLVTNGSVTVGTSTIFADYNITTTTVATTPLATIDGAVYRSMTFDIQAFDATSGKYSKATISAIHNDVVVDFTEYGAVAVAGVCGAYSVVMSGTSIFLNVIPSSVNSTVFKVHTTLIRR